MVDNDKESEQRNSEEIIKLKALIDRIKDSVKFSSQYRIYN